MFRFLHTADCRIGAVVPGCRPDKLDEHRELRLRALARVGEIAAEHACEFAIISGGLFADSTVSDGLVERTLEVLAAFELPVYVLPAEPDGHRLPFAPYQRDVFAEARPDNLQVLENPCVAGDVTLIPSWAISSAVSETAHTIAVAFARRPEAWASSFDYVALGGYPVTKGWSDNTWHSGTPEPTRFGQPGAGQILVVVKGPVTLEVTRVTSVVAEWRQHSATLSTGGAVDALLGWLGDIEDPKGTLVQLNLQGALSLEALERLERGLMTHRSRLLHLERTGVGVLPAATDAELDSVATQGYVRAALEALRDQAAAADTDVEMDTDARLAAKALQLAYQLNLEVQGVC